MLKIQDVLDSKNPQPQPKYWTGEIKAIDDFGDPIKNVFVDGRTVMGPWAIMSLNSYRKYGVGLGTGRGQMYHKEYTPNSTYKWRKIDG